MADIQNLLKDKDFNSVEEMNEYLQGLLADGGQVPHREATSDIERAQDLVYKAWEAPRPRRKEMAEKALRIYPNCADAYNLLAELSDNPDETLQLYMKGVAAGERMIGREYFEENVGHFWGVLGTRPYMRAREGLARCLWEAGRMEEAVAHYEDMLRLNPDDNQGIRYILLTLFLRTGQDDKLQALFKQFPDDGSADWLYGLALHAYRAEGDTVSSRRKLKDAKKHNKHVPIYLLGKKRLPKRKPDMIGMGDDSEAIACASEQLTAWKSSSGALEWLRNS